MAVWSQQRQYTTAATPASSQYSVRSDSSAFSSFAKPDEDWSKISSLAERRRIQNRIAQRIYRKKLKGRLEDSKRGAGTSNKFTPTQATGETTQKRAQFTPSADHDGELSSNETGNEKVQPYTSPCSADSMCLTHEETNVVSCESPTYTLAAVSYTHHPTNDQFSNAAKGVDDLQLENYSSGSVNHGFVPGRHVTHFDLYDQPDVKVKRLCTVPGTSLIRKPIEEYTNLPGSIFSFNIPDKWVPVSVAQPQEESANPSHASEELQEMLPGSSGDEVSDGVLNTIDTQMCRLYQIITEEMDTKKNIEIDAPRASPHAVGSDDNSVGCVSIKQGITATLWGPEWLKYNLGL